MGCELSGGLPGLATAGNRIVRAGTGEPVLLRGLNRSGLEYSEPGKHGFLATAGISQAEVGTIVTDWGANIIRLPFNQDWVLHGRGGWPADAYRASLDQVILWASGFGAYTLLDLQWLDAERVYGGDRNLVAPLPDRQSIEVWSVLAERYREEPAVLYDIFNEPHDRLPDDPFPLNREDGTTHPPDRYRVGMREWQPWARALIGAIRDAHPGALIFVSGVNWGYDLRGMPMDIPNLVYSTHVYRNKGADWAGAFGKLAAEVPVFAAEWGGSDGDLKWGRKLRDYFDSLEIGWTAWSWHNHPLLAEGLTPTQFGSLVRDSLIFTNPA
ncbi:MAG TPA: cellulase family glycosylhydrolase [Bryobacteraceae bacterium]|jgi:aryl-phospho-beta-D-glucosidase BglC (GH1 family)|nr:cellulase family glycosylhydrolase [Bryobacteraceae bacterium]